MKTRFGMFRDMVFGLEFSLLFYRKMEDMPSFLVFRLQIGPFVADGEIML